MVRDGTEVSKNSGECHPGRVGKFKEVIGALLYLSTRNSLDIAAAIGYLARHILSFSLTSDASWIGVTLLVSYLRGSSDFGIFFAEGENRHVPMLMIFASADCADDLTERESRSGILLYMQGASTA